MTKSSMAGRDWYFNSSLVMSVGFFQHSAKPGTRGTGEGDQRWANLDQASKHLEVFRFRDLSPTPIP
jgi:hypothetical protein